MSNIIDYHLNVREVRIAAIRRAGCYMGLSTSASRKLQGGVLATGERPDRAVSDRLADLARRSASGRERLVHVEPPDVRNGPVATESTVASRCDLPHNRS